MISAGQTQNVQTATAITLSTITSLACANGSDQERVQCSQGVADTYTANLERVPENLKQVFEGFAQVIANALFKVCPADPSDPLCSNGEINLWGGTYTFAAFLLELANELSGKICRFPIPNEIADSAAGLICELPPPSPGSASCIPNATQIQICLDDELREERGYSSRQECLQKICLPPCSTDDIQANLRGSECQ